MLLLCSPWLNSWLPSFFSTSVQYSLSDINTNTLWSSITFTETNTMKFLLEFVSCCASPESRRSDSRELPRESAEEESRSLMKVGLRRKRGRGVSVGPEWKPTLQAIYEDNTTPAAGEKKSGEGGKVSSDLRLVKRKSSGGGSCSRVHVRSSGEDFG